MMGLVFREEVSPPLKQPAQPRQDARGGTQGEPVGDACGPCTSPYACPAVLVCRGITCSRPPHSHSSLCCFPGGSVRGRGWGRVYSPQSPRGAGFTNGSRSVLARNALVVSFAALVAYSFEVTGYQPFVLTGQTAEGLPPVRLPPFSVTTANRTVSFTEMVQVGRGREPGLWAELRQPLAWFCLRPDASAS